VGRGGKGDGGWAEGRRDGGSMQEWVWETPPPKYVRCHGLSSHAGLPDVDEIKWRSNGDQIEIKWSSNRSEMDTTKPTCLIIATAS